MANYFVVPLQPTDPPDTKNMIVDKDRMCWIPPDPLNTDYAAYLTWVEEGNTAPPWTPGG